MGIGVLVMYTKFPKKFYPDEHDEPWCNYSFTYTGPSCAYNCCREKIELPEDSSSKVHSHYYNEDRVGSSNEEWVRFSTIFY